MDFRDATPIFDPSAYEDYWRNRSITIHGEGEPGSEEAKSMWNQKAPSFAKKPKRSGYISRLIDLLDLDEEESVFDMGCGPGTLSIPLALKGHDVIAADFSDGMLDQLRAEAKKQGVKDGLLHIYQRSWQQDWSDLPSSDIAISSRSFVTEDLADGIEKLESKAHKRVAVTLKAGELPYRDTKILSALGRPSPANAPDELSCLVGYLFSIGRAPRIDYVEYEGKTCRPNMESMRESIIETYLPTDEERPLLDKFLDEHVVFDEDSGQCCLDYSRCDKWALVTWDIKSI